jgi:hypothetical protein
VGHRADLDSVEKRKILCRAAYSQLVYRLSYPGCMIIQTKDNSCITVVETKFKKRAVTNKVGYGLFSLSSYRIKGTELQRGVNQMGISRGTVGCTHSYDFVFSKCGKTYRWDISYSLR